MLDFEQREYIKVYFGSTAIRAHIDSVYNYGIRVCIFIPRHDERSFYEKCPVCGDRPLLYGL